MMRARLAGMMFLQYFVMGIWSVTIPTFLMTAIPEGGLGLSGMQVGLLYSTHAVAGTIAPFLFGVLADRFIPAQRIYAGLHLTGAGVLYALYAFCRASQADLVEGLPEADPDAVWRSLMGLFLLNAVCYMPSVSLSGAIALRNLADPGRQFGQVRVVGTVGWLVAGLTVGLVMDPASPTPFLAASVTALLVGCYSISLPHTPPAREGKSLGEMLGLPAIRMFSAPAFRTFVLVTLLSTVLVSFHNIYLNRFLVDLGVRRAAAWQTVGQFVEVACILAIPLVRGRVGLKRMLLFGLVCSVVRFGFYASGHVPGLILIGIPMHGFCYSFYFIAAAIFIDAVAPRRLRASAQGLVSFLTLGIGAFIGNWLAGVVVDAFRTVDGINWPAVWSVPLIGSTVAAAWFAARFREPAPGHAHAERIDPEPIAVA
jgi:nucleoside transporter